MDFKQILTKSWQNIWHYKALWLFAMLVALTAASDLILLPLGETNGISNNQVKFTNDFVVHLPGEGLIVDLTQPEGMRIILMDGPSVYEINRLSDLAGVDYLAEIEAVGVTILSLFLTFALILMLGYYVAQTALIRMVAETESSGRKMSFVQGLRSGFSNKALRVFLLDFLFALVVIGTLALEIYLTIISFQTVDKFGELVVIATALGIAGMLFITVMLFVSLGFIFSVIKPNVRRAIVIGDKGIFSALAQGYSLLKNNFKEVGVTWLIWIGTRILWVPASFLVLILISPLLIFFLMAGLVAGAVPGLLAAVIASQFVTWVGALIIGAMVGTPIMIVVTVLPFLVVKGWVEIFKSSLWTYEYGELSAMKPVEKMVEQKESALKTTRIASEPAS
jgi:hypothetical protein